MDRADYEALKLRYSTQIENIAKKVSKIVPEVDYSELIMLGNQGLIRAAQKYTEEKKQRDIPFRIFAYYQIRGAMLHGVKKKGSKTYQRVRFEIRANDIISKASVDCNKITRHEAAQKFCGILTDLTHAYIENSKEHQESGTN